MNLQGVTDHQAQYGVENLPPLSFEAITQEAVKRLELQLNCWDEYRKLCHYECEVNPRGYTPLGTAFKEINMEESTSLFEPLEFTTLTLTDIQRISRFYLDAGRRTTTSRRRSC